ncbi:MULTISPECIES: hypothetical protein [Bacillus]|uniref:hypothetical protein n=1 Tax=Bacillus TaxID=1386 RepID=UPI001BB34A02|nr:MULTISPECIES: hypothetical protein [Bacillus]BCC09576.1 hypothetical protein BCM0060_p315 [Bacillus cereus]BCC50629.1 hypothetical protein BCJMU02_p326 [Bacillus cereus]
MERLFYDEKVLNIVSGAISMARDKGFTYDSTYLDYHNHICPRCQGEMVVKNKTVRNAGMVGMGIMQTTGYIYPYVVCKDCTKRVKKESKHLQDKNGQIIEEYIHSVLPYLGE